MPYILAVYTKQILEIKLFTFDYHEKKYQRMVSLHTNVLLDQRFSLCRSSPLSLDGSNFHYSINSHLYFFSLKYKYKFWFIFLFPVQSHLHCRTVCI